MGTSTPQSDSGKVQGTCGEKKGKPGRAFTTDLVSGIAQVPSFKVGGYISEVLIKTAQHFCFAPSCL